MERRWIVRPLAQADIEAAAAWYEEQQTGLGSRFVDAVDHVLTRIRKTPLQFPDISISVRRALLHTFPYAFYFRTTEESVVIRCCTLAATHAKGARGRSPHAVDGDAVHRCGQGVGALTGGWRELACGGRSLARHPNEAIRLRLAVEGARWLANRSSRGEPGERRLVENMHARESRVLAAAVKLDRG